MSFGIHHQAGPYTRPYLVMPRDLQRLRGYFTYNHETGEFIRNNTGKPAGKLNSKQRGRRALTVSYRGVAYSQARLIWYWVTGQDPQTNRISFKDGDSLNTRWENLELVAENVTYREVA